MAFRIRVKLFKSVLVEWKQFTRTGSNLSYFHNPGSEPLHYLTIGQLTARAAARWPDQEVFVSVQTQDRLTFSQADKQSSRLAAGLLSLGLVPGDRFAICSPNSAQWFLTALAAAKAGLILVSLNPACTTQELLYCLQKVSVRALVTDESYKSQNYYQMLCEILPSLSVQPPCSAVTSKDLPHLSFILVNSENKFPGTFNLQEMIDYTDNLDRLREVESRLRPEINGNIQFTSGTTGKPKAVPLSHFNLVNNSYFLGKRLGLDKKHKILAQTPFFHVLGYIGAMLSSLNFGSTMVLPSPSFSVVDSSKAIKAEKCNILLGTPTMYVDLCNHVASLPPEERLQYQSPEYAVSGGALCLPELLCNMKDTFSCQRVLSFYGLTETTAVIFQSHLHDSGFLMTSTVGSVAEHVEAKVVDSEGLTVPLGTPGELWVRSYNTAGYWEDTESTASMVTTDRWLKTGDRFILLEGGYGQVVGRIKDMIIRGGENISPKEVEEFLITHPDILDAQVYGVRSERLGEEVGCSLRLKNGCKLTDQQVRDFCEGKISYYKIPKYIEVVKEFPKTGSGKTQKFKLREAMEIKLGLKK